MFYTNYIHIVMNKSGQDPITLSKNQPVSKGDLIAYSYKTNSLDHIHFEVRDGSLFSRDACNPWKYLPNNDNDYSSFEASLTLTPNSGGTECQTVVNVSVPPDQLTFNRVELHILDGSDTPQKVRFYDFCGTNRNRTQEQVDNSSYLEDPNDDSSYLIRISPMYFNSQSFSNNQNAAWGFEFVDLPSLPGGGRVMAKIFDMFDNSISTDYEAYSCSSGETTAATTATATEEPSCGGCNRNDRIWPLTGDTSVDLPQALAYGPRKHSSGRYIIYRIVLIFRESKFLQRAVFERIR